MELSASDHIGSGFDCQNPVLWRELRTQTSPAPFEGLGLGAQDPHTPEITSLVGAEAQTSQLLEPLDPNGAGGKAAPISYAFAAPVLPL